jgi:hypothetical protein
MGWIRQINLQKRDCNTSKGITRKISNNIIESANKVNHPIYPWAYTFETISIYSMNLLELYQQTYTYDTGNNLTQLLHQANSSTWQQTLAIHLKWGLVPQAFPRSIIH